MENKQEMISHPPGVRIKTGRVREIWESSSLIPLVVISLHLLFVALILYPKFLDVGPSVLARSF